MTKSDRKSAIAAAATKKGSLKERLDNATSTGIVKPSKPAPVKIPSALNLTKSKEQAPRVEDAVTQTEGTMKEFVAAVDEAAKAAASKKRTAPAKAQPAEALAGLADSMKELAALKDSDKELDASVVAASVEKKAKKEKPAKDPNFLSVSDIAREFNIDPKRARARLRASGKAAADGRWPLVARGSEEHVAMSTIIKGDDNTSTEG